MDKIILGLLMFQPFTIYDIRTIIETKFSSMCSNSIGSIQAAIKKLLAQDMVTYEEFVEHSVNKKVYTITESGKNCFLEWVQTAMVPGKIKEMEISKLLFMGFVPEEKRILLIETYLDGLKKEKLFLEHVKQQDSNTAKLQYAAYMKEHNVLLKHFFQERGYLNIQSGLQEIIDFQLFALQFGIDRLDFEIQWFENLKGSLMESKKK